VCHEILTGKKKEREREKEGKWKERKKESNIFLNMPRNFDLVFTAPRI